MDRQSRTNCKHVVLESDHHYAVDDTLPLNEQVTQFQEKTAFQDKLIAEQAIQIYWLIAELRGRDTEAVAV